MVIFAHSVVAPAPPCVSLRVFADAQPLARPLPYRHPQGAIIWVKLPEPVLC